MGRYYVLVDREPVEVDMMTWAQQSGLREDWRVGYTEFEEDVHVSTVFLGLDHAWVPGPPLIFETMVFGNADDDEYCVRCSTWDDALMQHREAVAYCVRKLGKHPIAQTLNGVL